MSNHSLFSNIFGSNDNQKSSKKAQQRRRGRTLRIEELESREMLDAGLMAALDDAFKSSTPENETVIVETGNTVSGSSVVSGSPVAPAQADEPYPTPTNLHIYAHTSKTLTPAWDNMYSDYGATEYVLQWRAKGTFPNWDSPDHFTRVPFTITEYRISGLTPQTTYEIRVAAVYDNQFSQWSGTIEWTTDEPEPPDQRPAPENLRVSDTVLPTKDTIRLVWDSVEGAAAVNGYSVQYRKTADGPNAAWLLVSSGYDTFATVTGLAHDTEYEFRVRTNFSRFSEGGEGESDWSGSITGRTLPLVLPGIPVNLHSDTQTASIITLDWAAAANASRYQYQYCRTGTNNWTQEFITVDTSVTFFGFDSATSYDFRVRTENSDGISDWATFSVSTKAASETFIPAVPTATRSTNQTVYTLDVAWDSVLLAQNYTVQYRAANTTSWTSIQAAYNTARVYELVADTTYEFQVQARNSDGESGWSGIFQAKTNPLVMPDAPKNFKQTGRTAHGVTLEWDSVEGAYAYFIEYRRAGAGDDAWAAVPHTGATAGLYYQSPVNIGDNYVLQLDGGTEYEFRIKTLIREQRTAEFNGYLEYESVWSEPVKASTEPLLPVTVPSRLREFAKTDTTITMRFDAVPVDNPGNFQHSYEMRYRPAGSGEEDWVMSWVPAPANGNSMFSGLTAGTEYEFQIRAHNPNPIRQLTSDWSASVFVTTTGGVVTLPAVPTGLTSTNTTANSVTVTWTGVSNATSYEFQYRKAGAEWPADSTPTSQPSRVVNALDAETTYEFRVRAVNTAGESDWSESISVTTEAGGVVVTPPAVPTGLTSTAKTANSVTLSWTGVSTATSYGVQWKTSTGTWSTQGVTINGTTATVTGLAADTEYEFQVKAVNSDGESNWSPTYSARTETGGGVVPPPAVPTGLTSTAKTANSVTLSWTAASTATSYGVQWKTSTGTWSTQGVTINGTTATVTGLAADTEYEFQVKAVNSDGESNWSPTYSARTETGGGVVTPPAVPTGLTSTAQSQTSITLTWERVANATGYVIQYKTGTEAWKSITITSGTTLEREITGLDQNTQYEFQVKAVNSDGESNWSPTYSARTETGGGVVTPPAVPTGLTSTAKTANSVTLSWTAASTATSYGVQWKTGTGTWSTQGVTINGTTATVTGLAADTEYEFQVKAVNSDGESNWSGSVPVTTETEGTTPTPPAVPTGLTNTGKTRTSLAVAWESVAGATGYVIQYKTVDEEDWTSRDIDFGVTSYYVITDLIGGTEYEFRIGAVKDGATSVPSESMTAKTSTAAVPQSTAHSAIQKLQAGTKDALNKIAAVKKTATLSTLTFDLPAQSLMKGTAADGYTQILIQVWAPKNKATGKVGLLTSITVQVSQDSTGKVIYGEVESTYIDTKAEIKGGQLVLSGLDAGTKYTLQIQAVKNTNTITFNRDGKPTNVADGSKVLNVAGTTVKYPAVKPLKVDTAASAPFIKGVTTNSVALYWQAPKVTGQPLDAPIIKDTSWVIEVKDARGKEVVKSAVYGQVTGKGTVSDPYKVTITGLPEINTKYTVFVTAVSTLMNNDVISSAQSKVSPKTAKV